VNIERGDWLRKTGTHFLVLGLTLYFSFASFASDKSPECIIKGKPAGIDNHQVLVWKRTTKNQFQARAYIRGIVTRAFGKKGDHDHFEIQLDQHKDDTIEVIYNNHFGALPKLKTGQNVEACGDYITSYAKAGGYPASPSKAIIHWVHKNTRGGTHENGFVMIEGSLYGFPNHD